jgi:hypothetical protein
MSVEDDKHQAAAAGPGDPEPSAESSLSGLPRPVQEHLGQQLRTTYQAMAEKPAFLGDTSVPPELDRHLQSLETREKVRHQGLEAVRTALQEPDAPDAPDAPEAPKPVARRNVGRREGR